MDGNRVTELDSGECRCAACALAPALMLGFVRVGAGSYVPDDVDEREAVGASGLAPAPRLGIGSGRMIRPPEPDIVDSLLCNAGGGRFCSVSVVSEPSFEPPVSCFNVSTNALVRSQLWPTHIVARVLDQALHFLGHHWQNFNQQVLIPRQTTRGCSEVFSCSVIRSQRSCPRHRVRMTSRERTYFRFLQPLP